MIYILAVLRKLDLKRHTIVVIVQTLKQPFSRSRLAYPIVTPRRARASRALHKDWEWETILHRTLAPVPITIPKESGGRE